MATKVEMTGMPELVALFNGFGVVRQHSSLYLSSQANRDQRNPIRRYVELYYMDSNWAFQFGWMVTLTGSLMAMGKLRAAHSVYKKDDRGRSKWVSFPTWGHLGSTLIYSIIDGFFVDLAQYQRPH